MGAGGTACETHQRNHGFEKWRRIKVSGRKLLTSYVPNYSPNYSLSYAIKASVFE